MVSLQKVNTEIKIKRKYSYEYLSLDIYPYILLLDISLTNLFLCFIVCLFDKKCSKYKWQWIDYLKLLLLLCAEFINFFYASILRNCRKVGGREIYDWHSSKYQLSIGFGYIDTWVDCEPEQDAIYVFARYRNDTWVKRTRVKTALTGLPQLESILVLQVRIIREKGRKKMTKLQRCNSRYTIYYKKDSNQECVSTLYNIFTDARNLFYIMINIWHNEAS